jgi:hypothetical protein
VPYTRTVLDWEQASAALKDPLGALKETYAWGDPARDFEHQRLLRALAQVLRALKLPVRLTAPGAVANLPPDNGFQVKTDVEALRIDVLYQLSLLDQAIYQVGIEVAPATESGKLQPSGLVLGPVLRGGLGQTLPLGRDFKFRWTAAADAGAAMGVALFPDRVALARGELVLGAALEIFSTRTTPWYLLGNPRTARIELSGLSLRASTEGATSSPECKLHLKMTGTNGQPGCKVVVPMEESDGFLKETLQEKPIEFGFSPEIVWSSKTGLTFNGSPNLDIELPVNRSIGGFTLLYVRIALQQGPRSSLVLRFETGIQGKLGPLQLLVERMGFACQATPYSRQALLARPPGEEPPVLGNLDLNLKFAPPLGIAISIDSTAVTGGGYLFFDPVNQQYAGAVQLEFGNVELNAVGHLTTRMPDGSRGFSLIISITAQGFQPVQLGFGFRLSGVGGLVGVNRTVAVEALRSGLKDRTLDSILFPKDPLRNIAQIVSNMRKAFPPARGRFIFGPLFVIDWGTPPVLTMDVAVILELPSPVRLIVLGQIRALLPSKEKAVVRLNMDALGVLEFEKGELAIDAVLYDSRVLTFAVSGEMALRARWATDPLFIMAAGGLNPNFKPPAGFPKLKRLAVSLTQGDNPRLRLEAYLALTSNTAQIGARLDLRVSAASFSIEGYLHFDALFEFSPFQFTVDLGAGVTLKWHGRTLLGVQLAMTLTGPTRWRAKGEATFKIWIFSKSVSFDKTFGRQEAPPVLPPADPLPELIAALRDLRSWSGAVPGGARGLVSLRETASNGDLLVHPLGQIGVRQRVVPLDIEISKFGNTAPAGERRFRITQVRLGTNTVQSRVLTDYFAPGQFLQLNEAESLSRPSFEQLPSGVELAGDAVAFGGRQDPGLMATAAVEYETITISPGGGFAKPKTKTAMPQGTLLATATLSAAAHAAVRRTGAAKYRGEQRQVAPEEPRYVLARTGDLTAAPEAPETAQGTSYTAAAQRLSRQIAANPALKGRIKVIARHELAGVEP